MTIVAAQESRLTWKKFYRMVKINCMLIVSACLAGFNVRYDGTNSEDRRVVEMVASGKAIPLCPEQLGGLPTLRVPIELSGGDGGALIKGLQGVSATGKDGIDYSGNLKSGAAEVMRIARMFNVTGAVFKDRSPSCGVSNVWVDNRLIKGSGVTTALLRVNGIPVKGIDEI